MDAAPPPPPPKPRPLKRQLTRHVVTRWYRGPELILLQVGAPVNRLERKQESKQVTSCESTCGQEKQRAALLTHARTLPVHLI